MTRAKPAENTRSQRQKFVDAARELGANGDENTFRRVVRKVATAPVAKPKKVASKRKS